jgi:hypothetical protein
MQQLADQIKFNNSKSHRNKKPTQGVIGRNNISCWVQTPLTAPKFLKQPYVTKSGQHKNRLVSNPDSHPVKLEDGTIKKIVHFIN